MISEGNFKTVESVNFAMNLNQSSRRVSYILLKISHFCYKVQELCFLQKCRKSFYTLQMVYKFHSNVWCKITKVGVVCSFYFLSSSNNVFHSAWNLNRLVRYTTKGPWRCTGNKVVSTVTKGCQVCTYMHVNRFFFTGETVYYTSVADCNCNHTLFQLRFTLWDQ